MQIESNAIFSNTEETIKKRKILTIENVFYLALILLVGGTIFILSYNLLFKQNVIEISSDINNEQLSNIERVVKDAANANGNISNIVGATAIFFTVLTVTVNFFQFIKAKEIDKLRDDMELKVEEYEKKIRVQYEKKQKEYTIKINELEELYAKQEKDFQSFKEKQDKKLSEINNNQVLIIYMIQQSMANK